MYIYLPEFTRSLSLKKNKIHQVPHINHSYSTNQSQYLLPNRSTIDMTVASCSKVEFQKNIVFLLRCTYDVCGSYCCHQITAIFCITSPLLTTALWYWKRSILVEKGEKLNIINWQMNRVMKQHMPSQILHHFNVTRVYFEKLLRSDTSSSTSFDCVFSYMNFTLS